MDFGGSVFTENALLHQLQDIFRGYALTDEAKRDGRVDSPENNQLDSVRGRGGVRSLPAGQFGSVRLARRRFRTRGATSFTAKLFLWQEVAHQRFSYCGRSHIFVHRLARFHARTGNSKSASADSNQSGLIGWPRPRPAPQENCNSERLTDSGGP